MKTKITLTKLFFTFYFLLFSYLSFAQWELLYPIPSEKDLEDVCFVDDMNGWAVGEQGTIIYTNNGGFTWSIQNSGTNLRLRSLVFTDLQTGWIVGGESFFPNQREYIILHTSDGGINWSIQESGTTTCFISVFFIDSDLGWAVGENGSILHTENGGTIWMSQWNGSPYIDFNEVFFIDSQNGWVTSESGLYKTTDGGVNWETQFENGSFLSVHFINQTEGWVTTSGVGCSIIHTTDAGINWETLSYSIGYESFQGYNSVFFKDNLNGWMYHFGWTYGGWGSWPWCSLKQTTDGGNSWESIELQPDLDLNSLCFTQGGKGYLVGDHGIIFNSDNWGEQWVQQSQGNGSMFYSICFPDELNGWAVGSKNWISPGFLTGSEIIHTPDGGITWTEQNSTIPAPLRSVSFIDSNTGWAVGNSNDTNYIINTSNGGDGWLMQKCDTAYYLNSINFADAIHGWAVGRYEDNYGNYKGKILKTSDGGNSWEQQDCDTCHALNSVFFVDQDHGWVVGSSIYSTIDGGQNWTQQLYDTTGFTLTSVFFTDIYNGWAVGYGYQGIILHTIDGGNNWLSEIIDENLFSVHFKDNENGLISGIDGTILLTQDGGATWESQDSGTENTLFSIYYTSSGHAFASGRWGTIVHSSPVTTSVHKNPFNKNAIFDLQCFPNPFSETTTLSYSLCRKSLVSIDIYNSNGQLVFNQDNEVKSEGQYEIMFNSKGLPPGIYFCVLKTSEGLQTTKMIKH